MPTTTTASSAPQSTDGQGHPVFMQPCTAVKLSDNGDILFKMKANEDASVTVSIGNDHKSQITIPMQNLHNGIFEASFSGCTLTGPQKLVFRVNGQETLNPFAPLWFHANSLSNYIELPDPETDTLIAPRKDIPHGAVTHEFYYSRTYQEFMSSTVYTPPGFKNGKEYPVLYLFHEVAENKTAWTDASRMNYLLDNLIADGKCEPLIVVENDCTVMLDYHDRPDWFENYSQLEHFLIQDCVPFIEDKYHTKTGKWSRAIAGIGLGAVQAGYIGMRNTDIFGNIGLFTAFWISAAFHAEGKEDPFYTAAEYIGRHPEVIKVFFRSEGDLDIHFKGIEAENNLLSELGIDKIPGYLFKVYHQTHNWGSYRRSLRDFVPLLFHE